jgi:hypothetical protein
MLDLTHHAFTADKARTLLRRLRDANLRSGPIAVKENLTASLAGCSSLDAPAECGVRYRVRVNGTSDALMELAWTESGLELALTANPGDVRTRNAATLAKLCVSIACDRQGRACARELGARVSPDSTDERQLEHFLRRALRSLLQ